MLFFHRQLRYILAVAFALVSALSVFPPSDAEAGSGGKKASKPRSEANAVPGDYIQLDVIWIPVVDGQKTLYQGLFVRLFVPPPPEPVEGAPPSNARYQACVKAPWARQAIIAALNDIPASRKEFADEAKLKRRVEQAVQTISKEKVYRSIEISTNVLVPDADAAMLSNTCK
ncbi:hypothetical protein HEQ63_06575 [Haematospirillum jordaniae]|uniref:hypothetical protein n=1 Tax=Haematospirillum jordaniae TaxID=1549855 RepID=UPI001432BABF|nr:hypothetical protein [Haematospirillum jordaniae]NKD85846.1 hypothetical protein [Haematospirillum jordaniae]